MLVFMEMERMLRPKYTFRLTDTVSQRPSSRNCSVRRNLLASAYRLWTEQFELVHAGNAFEDPLPKNPKQPEPEPPLHGLKVIVLGQHGL